MISFSRRETGSMARPMNPPQSGRMNMTAATLMASSRMRFTS